MFILIDVILVLVILVCAFLSARKGFVKSIIEVAGFVLAIMLSMSLSAPISGYVYDKAIEPKIISSTSQLTEEKSDVAAQNFWDSLPDFVTENAEKMGLNITHITDGFNEAARDNIAETTASLSQKSIKPIFVEVTSLLVSTILFIVFMFIVRILAKLINKFFSFSVVGKLNSALGGILGIVKGVVVAVVICSVIAFVTSFLKNGIWIFTKENLDKTYIYKLLSGFVSL